MQRELLEKWEMILATKYEATHLTVKSSHHTRNCMEEQNCVFSGKNGSATSIHDPRKGERRSRYTWCPFCKSSSIVAENYLF